MLAEEPRALTDVEIYRYVEFGRLGFSLRESRELAVSQADLHEVARLLSRGCPLDTAFRISL